MSLIELQYLLSKTLGFDSSFQQSKLKEQVADLIVDQGELTALERLQIYRNSIFAALCDALKNTFPICQQVVGEAYFLQLCRSYIAKVPSRQQNLDCYGEQFAAHLKLLIETRPELAEIAYVVDLAKIEWAVQLAYSARDETVLLAVDLQKLSPEQQNHFIPKLCDSVHVLSLESRADLLWTAHQERLTNSLEIEMSRCTAVIWRDTHSICVEVIDDDQLNFLNCVEKSMSLKNIAVSYTDPEMFITTLSAALSKGWLVADPQTSC